MRVIINKRYGIIGKSVQYFDNISDTKDLQRVIASLVNSSDAWIDDIRVVGRGYVKMFAMNKPQALVNVITGVTKELPDDINRTI